MAQTLRLKRSSVAGRVPTTSSLQTGEIAINTADGLVYIRKDDDTIIPLLGLNNVTTGNIYTTGSVVVLGNIRATSFEGGFTGSFSGSIDSPLSGIISGGTEGGFEEFTYDGRTSVSLSIDTGSAHFLDAVNDLVSGSRTLLSPVDTTGAAGINLSYNPDTGELSASLATTTFTIGDTQVQLGGTVSSIDGVSLTNTSISGSFSGSLVGNLQGTATSANFATTASYALNVVPVDTGSLLANATVIGSNLTFTRGDGTDFILAVNNVASASFATNADISRFASTANVAATASYTTLAITAATASSANDFTVRGDLTVDGIVTAQEFHTEFISASIVYESGSTKFGDSADDIHSFTGSLAVSGAITSEDISINGFPSVSASLAGSTNLQGITDNGNSTTLPISASNLNIEGFPDVSASLAAISASAAGAYGQTLQDVTDNGSLTTNHISISSSLNVSGSIISKGEDVLDFAVAMAIALG